MNDKIEFAYINPANNFIKKKLLMKIFAIQKEKNCFQRKRN